MIPILFDGSATSFTTHGLGALTDAISCKVVEERNGPYELTLEYPMTGRHYSEIAANSLILAQPNFTDNPQAFRVYKITKPLNGKVTVYAQHISYDLSGVPVAPFTAAGNIAAAAGLNTNAMISTPFTVSCSWTATGDANFTVDAPTSMRSWFAGKQGSLVDLYGGEWSYDNFLCVLNQYRGTNRGVTVRYGKNLTSYEQEENIASLYTGAIGYWKGETGLVTGDIVYSDGTFDFQKILSVDLSSKFQEEPTVQQVTDATASYATANKISEPAVSIKLDFVQIGTLKDRVDLCDTVSVYFDKLGVSATAKCVKTTWNVLLDRYDSIELGSAYTNLNATIQGISQTTAEDVMSGQIGHLQTMMRDATELITGNLGGYVVIHDSDEDGYPDELLIMDTPDISTAVRVWRWNQAGLGYSGTGYAGPYGLAMTQDGQIVADYITAGTMSANLIRGGTLILGRDNNASGLIQVYDSGNALVGQVDKDGFKVFGADGSYVLMNNSVGFAGFDSQNNKIFWAAADEFYMKKAVVNEEITLCSKMRFIPITIYDGNNNVINDGIGLVSVEG